MPGSNAGTGWPIHFRCSKCRRDAGGRGGWDVVRTGRTRPYRGGNQGVRGLRTFHEYRCKCGHVGWSRHVDIARKLLEADVITTKEIGERINAHLKRFETDPKINTDLSPTKSGLYAYFRAGAHGIGKWVYVNYVSYQGNSALTKSDAYKYLAWLDAGNEGKHHKLEMMRTR